MNSHDIGRDRGGVAAALSRVSARNLVLGIDSDRLFPVADQIAIARGVSGNIDDGQAVVIHSDFGHDGFLIEDSLVGAQLARLLEP
jgi:homoserine O-acetyltransferase